MPKIPEYESRQLASSVVGTPGVDTSTASVFNSAATAFGAVADSARQQLQLEYVENMRELRARQAEQRAAERALQSMQEDSEVARFASKYSTKATAARGALAEKHAFNTDGAMDAFKGETDRAINEIVEGIANPQLQAKTLKTLLQRQTSDIEEFGKWTTGRAVPIMEANLRQSAGALAVQLGDSTRADDAVQKDLQNYETDNLTTYERLYGPSAKEMLRRDISGALEKRIADAANRGDAVRLEQEIETWTGRELLDPERAGAFLSKQREIAALQARQIEREREYQTAWQANETLGNLALGQANNTVTPQDFENARQWAKANKAAPSTIQAINAREAAWINARKQDMKQATEQAEKEIDAQDAADAKAKQAAAKNAARLQLAGDRRELIYRGRKDGKAVLGATKNATAGQVSEYLGRIDAALAQGHITAEMANASRNEALSALKALDRKDPQGAKNASNMLKRADEMSRWAANMVNTPTLRGPAAATAISTFYANVEAESKRKGRSLTDLELDRLSAAAKAFAQSKLRAEYEAKMKAREDRIRQRVNQMSGDR